MNHFSSKHGFAMLFTVLIVTLVLSIAIGISNSAFKQTVLSSLAKDSQIAFYQADTAVECGLYYDTIENIFPLDMDIADVVSKTPLISCADVMYQIDTAVSYTNFLVYTVEKPDSTKPCSSIVFDKITSSTVARIQGRGYNLCGENPRQVERGLEVQYDLI